MVGECRYSWLSATAYFPSVGKKKISMRMGGFLLPWGGQDLKERTVSKDDDGGRIPWAPGIRRGRVQ